MVFSIFPVPPLLSIIIQFHVFVGFVHTFVFFPSKGYSDISVPLNSLSLYFLCRNSSSFQEKEDTCGEKKQNIKIIQKVWMFFPNKTIKWDCVDPKCFDRKFGRANTQKANSHNTAAWSLILTTGSVFCVSVASFVFTIYRILLTH